MSSPSDLRREGRRAYYRGGNPSEICPYKGSLIADIKRNDWLTGWREAEVADDLGQIEEERAAEKLQASVEKFARFYNLAKEQGLIA